MLAATAASFLLASPAYATANLFCEGEGASLDALMGRLIVVQILGATVEIGGKTYSTAPDATNAEPFDVGQAFGEPDGSNLMIDFVDPNIESVLVGLRVTWDDALEVYSGKMTSGGTSVDVTCDMG